MRLSPHSYDTLTSTKNYTETSSQNLASLGGRRLQRQCQSAVATNSEDRAGRLASVRGGPRSPSAAAAPRTDKPAATIRAGRYPFVTVDGPARLPLALKTAVTTAMPTTAPNCCSVLSVPAALPKSAGAAAFRPAAVTQGSAIDTPMPAITKGAT